MPSDPTPDALPAAVRRGVPWLIAGQVSAPLISLVSLACLFRLIGPADFGLFGMALPIVMVVRMLATLGLATATVQYPSLSHEERSGLFWLQAAQGGAGMLLLLGIAPLAAWVYGAPEVMVLIQLLAATVLVASLGATHQALLERRLALARVTVVRIVGQLLGAIVAVIAAWYGWRYHALVVQQYGELLALLLSSWLAQPWWPTWPKSWRSSLAALSFGGYYSLSSLLFFAAQNADKFLLSVWLGGTPAGQAIIGAYTQAYNLMMRPVFLVATPISGVLLPVLARSASDHALFTHWTRAAYRLTALLLLPAAVGVFLTAPEIMLTLGGSKWSDAARLLVPLAPIIAVQGWIQLSGMVLAARGLTRLLCFGAFVVFLISLQGIVAGYWWGAQQGEELSAALGLATGLALVTTLILGIPYVGMCLTATGVAPLAIFRTALRPLVASCMMGVLVGLLAQQLPVHWPPPLRLVILALTGMASYFVLVISEVRQIWPVKS
jgi:PST family polysaccharide transporter